MCATIFSCLRAVHLCLKFSQRKSNMKSAIRIFALLVVFAGAVAATVSSSSTLMIPSHQSASAAYPAPGNIPTRPQVITAAYPAPGNIPTRPQVTTAAYPAPGNIPTKPQVATAAYPAPGNIPTRPQVATAAYPAPGNIPTKPQ